MSFRSLTSLPKRIGSWILLVGIAGLPTDACQTADAAKPQSSPFAGRYCIDAEGDALATISNSGDIRADNRYEFWGSVIRVTLKGSITHGGHIEVTSTWSIKSPRDGWTTYPPESGVGFGALDEEGNLNGWMEWEGGGGGPFLWLRCD
jgi:hypothetical protein